MEQKDVKDVALQVLQNELNNANARIIQVTTELVMTRNELEECKKLIPEKEE